MDLFELFGGMAVEERTDSLVEKTGQKKGADCKDASKKKSEKKNPARRVKFSYPVTVVGRNFKVEITGDGEVSLQDLAEKLFQELGYKEVAHKGIRFVKLSESLLMLDYQCLRQSSHDIVLTLPVTIADGMLNAVMEKDQNTDDDGEEEITVKRLVETGLPDELYRGIPYDYDPTSGIALPVFPSEDVAKVSVNAGEVVRCFGNAEPVADPAAVVDQMMGELPENVTPICYTGNNGRILYYRASGTAKLEKIERSSFQVDETKIATVAEEKITLPVVVLFVNFTREYTVTQQDLGGKKKVSWEELFSYVKSIEPLFAQSDRKTDHLYDEKKGMVSVALFSGRKGCVHPAYSVEDGFTMSRRIPRHILEEVVAYFAQDLTKEAIVQIWSRDGEYYVVYPEFQDSAKSFVEYRFSISSEGIYVMTIHSHNTMRPVPSSIDDKDELRVPGLYGIIGSIRKRDATIFYESFFRVTRLDKEPITVDEEEIFVGGMEVCA